jgi:hypothetical protein
MPDIVRGGQVATFINTFRCDPRDQAEVVQISVDLVDHPLSDTTTRIRRLIGYPGPNGLSTDR